MVKKSWPQDVVETILDGMEDIVLVGIWAHYKLGRAFRMWIDSPTWEVYFKFAIWIRVYLSTRNGFLLGVSRKRNARPFESGVRCNRITRKEADLWPQ